VETILTATEPWQASLAVGAVNEGGVGDGHPLTEVLLPWPPILGAVISLTVIDWLTLPLVLPQASKAFHVRVYTIAQLLPEVRVETILTETAPQLSEAVGAVKSGVVLVAGQPDTDVLAPGEPIMGGSLSIIL
jgi:hypothetical protein